MGMKNKRTIGITIYKSDGVGAYFYNLSHSGLHWRSDNGVSTNMDAYELI